MNTADSVSPSSRPSLRRDLVGGGGPERGVNCQVTDRTLRHLGADVTAGGGAADGGSATPSGLPFPAVGGRQKNRLDGVGVSCFEPLVLGTGPVFLFPLFFFLA